MKKLHKFAATMAMALSLGVTHQAYASQALGPFPDRGGIVLDNGGRGDALLFPVFHGSAENYFTISNSSGEWIQGHLRFRGAAWSGELLDFDVILSPGDVFLFRLADIDGDGRWEIDESLDLRNFQYTGMNMSCSPEGGTGVSRANCIDQQTLLIPAPTDQDTGVWAGGNITPALIDHHRRMGYIEFIGEGIFYPRILMDQWMDQFINPANANALANNGQRRTGNGLGTSLWSWVNGFAAYPDPAGDGGDPVIATIPANVPTGLNPSYNVAGVAESCFPIAQGNSGNFADTGGLADSCIRRTARGVPNVLSGTAFIANVGQGHGVAYNAETFFDFRTNTNSTNTNSTNSGNRTCTAGLAAQGSDCGSRRVAHRVDNYPTDNSVILHHENPLANATYSYVYAYAPAPENVFEARISFNNTWGPTLADGNDYNLVQDIAPANLPFVGNEYRWTDPGNQGVADTWDFEMNTPNSIAEVEEAIRKGYPSITPLTVYTPDAASSRQRFTGFYWDNSTTLGGGNLSSSYFAFFPTKYFYGEHPGYWVGPAPQRPGRNERGDPNGDADDLKLLGRRGYLEAAVTNLLQWSKPFNVELWDIFERTPSPEKTECVFSPCVVPEGPTEIFSVREELAIFTIKDLKNLFASAGTAHQAWTAGRIVMRVPPASNMCIVSDPRGFGCQGTYPGLLYTFDFDSTTGHFAHWRPLER